MKIIKLKVKDLHKYITKEIIFNPDLSIITGVNGSGKTSILSLIEAVFRVDIKKINETSFKKLEILIKLNKRKYNIVIEKAKSEPNVGFVFSVNSNSINIETVNKINMFNTRKGYIESDFLDKMEIEMAKDDSDFSVFSKINTPMLIGLNRRVSKRKQDHFAREELFDHYDFNIFDDNETKEIDSFDLALNECKKLINIEFKRIKKYETVQLNSLRNNIISSSFKYIEDFDEIIGSKTVMESKFIEVKERRDEILDVLANIELKGGELNVMTLSFFEKLDELYEKVFVINAREEENRFTLEYLLNIIQVERIYNLVKIIDEHKSNLDEKRKKIDLFERIVNSFFEETDKKVIINSFGKLYLSINNSNHRVEIDQLSSGEKQLVIIIANMVFSSKNGLTNIIIDEPEISLHIKWQDMFISALREINSNIQLILATHSPDIIGDYDNYCTPIESWS